MTAFKDLCDRADKHDLLVGLDATKTTLARITLTTEGRYTSRVPVDHGR